jgi:hypothetical protein
MGVLPESQTFAVTGSRKLAPPLQVAACSALGFSQLTQFDNSKTELFCVRFRRQEASSWPGPTALGYWTVQL